MQRTAWTLLCLLLFRAENAGCGQDRLCTLAPAGTLHPVQGFLERFDVGLGCAARESGPKETHIITMARASYSSKQQVTVVLRPLSYSKPPNRPVHLVLSSFHPVHWWLEAEGLPLGFLVRAQVSQNSTVESLNVGVRLQRELSLPWHPRSLLQWGLEQHGTISSLTHATYANRIYIRLGEDPTLPKECHLQPLFLSRNYLTSDVQPQEVQGCVLPTAEPDPEVHIIKLWSAGSGLCGSLQVEVSVSLLPPLVNSGWHKLVLILSSSTPVNWAITATGIRGHILVYASNSVTPLYPPRPDLTMTSVLSYDLLSTSDLLEWANENSFPKVTSYTEADLANRFVIRVVGGGSDQNAMVPVRPPWLGKPRLKQWLSGNEVAKKAVSTQCQDGRLMVAVEKHPLQELYLPLSSVSLRDPSCQARSNGSHFLLAFPVISCGTEGLLEGSSPVFQYKNVVLLWRHKLPALIQNETEFVWTTDQAPVAIPFSCEAPGPNLLDPKPLRPPVGISVTGSGEISGGQKEPPFPWMFAPRTVPQLTMELFVTEHYEKRQAGPCIITAENRVYVQILATGVFKGSMEVQSCVVSPHSDPQVSPSWPVILNGCSQEPTFILTPLRKKSEAKGETPEKEEEANDGGNYEEDREEEDEEDDEVDDDEEERVQALALRRLVKTAQPGWERRSQRSVGEKQTQGGGRVKTSRLRFSFVLWPVFNNSFHFLHCSVQQCSPTADTQMPMAGRAVRRVCQGVAIPALIKPQLVSQKCDYRNLSRPMLVTAPLKQEKLLPPPAGQRNDMRKPLRNAAAGGLDIKRMKQHVIPQLPPTPLQRDSVVGTGPILGIVIVAFLMGISLMGALWCVYTHVGIREAAPDSLGGMGREEWNHAGLLEPAGLCSTPV